MNDYEKWKVEYYETIHQQWLNGSCTICLDHYNQRVRLDEGIGEAVELLQRLEEAATRIGAHKIIAKVRAKEVITWIANGYIIEGIWDSYFNGTDAIGVCRYVLDQRRNHSTGTIEDQLIRSLQQRIVKPLAALEPPYLTRRAMKEDAESLSMLYRRVFGAYPTPVHDPLYVAHRINEGAIIRAIWNVHGQIVSAATIEPNQPLGNGEVTDCATDPLHRGNGWMRILIHDLHDDAKKAGFVMLYALSRAGIPAINATLSDLGYQYRGRFVNNCRMEQGFENMNLWVYLL